MILAEDGFEAWLQPDRTIVSIEADPGRPTLSRLVGSRGGGGLRQALEAAVPEERRRATPLYLILDDIAGASLVSGWAWSQWDTEWLSTARSALKDFDLEKAFRSRVGICAGFAEGSTRLIPTRIVPARRHPICATPTTPKDGTPSPIRPAPSACGARAGWTCDGSIRGS